MSIQVVRAHLAKHPAPDALDAQRDQYDKAERFFKVPSDVAVEPLNVGTLTAEWLRPAGARPDVTVLYLHGGGYAIGSVKSHRHLAAAIAKASGARALLIDYRRAPENPFPAAVEDAVAGYRWLLEQGQTPGRIVVAGDSAGGGLTVATLLALRDAGATLPAAGVCISPWVDLACSGQSYQTKAASDPIVTRDGVGRMASWYLAGADPRTPLAAPLYADLHSLPPLLIHVGSDEVLLDDARQLAARARAAGVEATLDVWPEMIHVWHWFLGMLDEAQRAVDGIGEFVRSATSLMTAPTRGSA
ncbi:MAG: alpha/beta hydrolase [Candidatus Rokuibacteriota bacterium]|nr:MAG: alpha/beta hydrolase [Candidatus Rokubacteria bacterium]